jgi:hypothetical protein
VVHPIIHTLFPNNDAVFQDGIASIYKAWTVQLRFEKHEGELTIFLGQHNYQNWVLLNHSLQSSFCYEYFQCSNLTGHSLWEVLK